MTEKKRLVFSAVAVSLVAIVTGLFLGSDLLSQAYQPYDESTTTANTTITVSHSHDDISEHIHTITTVVTTIETTPHGYFHDFVQATASTITPTAPVTTTARAINEVLIRGWGFNPQTITVPVGTTVTWKNLEREGHSIESTAGLFRGGIDWNHTFSYTFSEPGVFEYHCGPHPDMQGTVIVK